jgi:hypothetical protein
MTSPAPGPAPSAGPRLARLGPALAALATFALHAACGGRYGIFRDELYFLACGERLAAGYVDQPPGIAVVARLAHSLFGTWVPGLRLFAWLATAGTVYLAGRLAWRLATLADDRNEPRDAPRAVAAANLAAVATFACLVLRGTAHMLSMNAFEPLLLTALALVLLRLAQGEDLRLWVAAGGLAGLAVLFKYSAAPVALALVLGLLVTPARRALFTPWALAGVAVGALAVLPNFLWQASHGFPFVELVRNGVLYKNTATTPLQFLGGVAFEANPGNLPIWLGGLVWLLVAPRARIARFVGVGCLLQLAALTLGHAKPYYVAGVLPALLAAGGAAFAALVPSRGVQRVYGAGLVVSALAFAPMAVPLLPEETFIGYQRALGVAPRPSEKLAQSVLPQTYADMHGWEELVEGVARVYRALPPEEQARVAVFGSNYGVASAVELLGPAHGLPRGLAVSGHNSYWFWGVPRGRGDPLILVGRPTDGCFGLYGEAKVGAQLPRTPYVMPYEDAHTLWLCRGAHSRTGALPAEARHFE